MTVVSEGSIPKDQIKSEDGKVMVIVMVMWWW
jgi:hypothetical protein